MNAPAISQEHFDTIFASLPWIVGISILLITYVMVRGSLGKTTPIGQTFACAGCGRRGARDHMVPAAQEGAVTWYCSHCAHDH
jgi:hypothetical protein